MNILAPSFGRDMAFLLFSLFFILPSSLQAQSPVPLSGIVNEYGEVLWINEQKCKLKITNPEGFSIGDKILIHQSKGATFNTAQTNEYGDAVDMANAGNFEVNTVLTVVGDTLVLTHKLLRDYDPGFGVQVVGLPDMLDAEVTAEVTAKPWDGKTGGIVFLLAHGTLELNAPVIADSIGYIGGQTARGGNRENTFEYAFTDQAIGGSKGESMAFPVTQNVSPSNYGRGKIITGGGGGNNHNAGGGGGANYGAGGLGGRALQTKRRITTDNDSNDGNTPGELIGGLGGMSLSDNFKLTSFNKIFMGGGGGAGHQNSGTSAFKNRRHSRGQNGGGIIILSANYLITNNNKISANGGSYPALATVSADRIPNSTTDNASGGGGAGGSVLIDADGVAGGLLIDLNGGNGGHTYKGNVQDAYGPGGGGGGGTLSLSKAQYLNQTTWSATGGEAGTIQENSVLFSADKFYGSKPGALGGIAFGISLLEGTIPCNDAPNAEDDLGYTGANTPISLNFLKNDQANTSVDFNVLSHFKNGSLTVEDSIMTYTPVNGFIGQDTLEYELCVGTGANKACDPAYVIIQVIPDEAPKLKDSFYSLTTFGPFQIHIDELAENLPENYTLTICEDPELGTVTVIDNKILEYIPDYITEAGQAQFCYEVCVNPNTEDEACSTGEIVIPFDYDITVLTLEDDVNTTPNTTITFDPTINDKAPEGYTISLCNTGQTQGNATVLADQQIQYTPPTDFEGQDAICYTLCDPTGEQCHSNIINVEVATAWNVQLTDDETQTPYRSPIDINVLINDTELPEDDSYSLQICNTQVNGTATITAENEIRYVPNDNFFGKEIICYSVCSTNNPELCEEAFAVVEVVIDPNEIPSIFPVEVNTQPDAVPFVFDPAQIPQFQLPPNYEIILIEGPEAGDAIIVDGKIIKYTLDPSQEGTFKIKYQLCNTLPQYDDQCSEAYLTFDSFYPSTTVAPQTDSDIIQQGEVASVNVYENDQINNGTFGSITLVNPTSDNGTVSVNDKTITFTPNADFIGTEIIQYELCSQEGPCAQSQLFVSVNPQANDDNSPVIYTINYNLSANTPIPAFDPATITAFDLPPNYALTILEQPTDGTVNLNGNVITYVPDANQGAGIYSIKYEICNTDPAHTDKCASAYLTYDIYAPSAIVVAQTDGATTPQGVEVTVDVVANDRIENDEFESISIISGGDNGTVSIEGDQVKFIPDPSFFGTEIITYELCSKGAVCAQSQLFISVNRTAIPISEIPNIHALTLNIESNAPEQTFIPGNISDFELPDNYELTIIEQPTEGSVTVDNGNIKFTPTPDQSGVAQIRYRICNTREGYTDQCDESILNYDITAPDISIIAQTDIAIINQGETAEVNIFANDDLGSGTFASITTDATSINGGAIALSDDTKTLTYTPQAGFFGTDILTYQLCTSEGPCAEGLVFITVHRQEVPADEIPEVYPLTYYIQPTDAPEVFNPNLIEDFIIPANYTINITEQPDFGTAVVEDGKIKFTPDPNQEGAFKIKYEVCNTQPTFADQCDETYLTYEVRLPNAEVIAQTDSKNIQQGEVAIIDLFANDRIVNGSFGSMNIVSASLNGTVSLDNTTLTFTPKPTFTGTEIITYELCSEDGQCTQALAFISINAMEALDAEEDFISTPHQTPVIVDVKANDQFDRPVTVALCEPLSPDIGIADLNDDGSFLFTPAETFFGTAVFCYQICDEEITSNCAKAFVIIDVQKPEELKLNTDQASVLVNQSVLVPVTENDNISANEIKSVTVCSQPAFGTVVADGLSILYTAGASPSNEPIIFCYEVCDIYGRCKTSFVMVEVTGELKDFTLANDEKVIAPEGASTIDFLDNDELPENYTVILCDTEFPGTATLTSGLMLEYTPDPSSSTSYVDICYQVCERKNGQKVNCKNSNIRLSMFEGLQAVDDTYETSINQGVDISPWENDEYPRDSEMDLPPYFKIITQPTNGTIYPGTDFITYVPDTSFVGTDQFTYTICYDSKSDLCDTAMVTINITQQVALNIFNAVSPNGDGLNETFYIEDLEQFSKNQLLIFNRWGEKVYQVSNYKNDWAGTDSRNRPLPDGTYYYVLKIVGIDEEFSGFITIQR